MSKTSEFFRALHTCDDGASVVEYGVLIALVIATCIAIIIILGNQVQGGFRSFTQLIDSYGMTAPGSGS